MKKTFALLLSLVSTIAAAQGRELQPLPQDRLSAVLTFFAIDTSVPLDAHVVDRGMVQGFIREKIVFTGARGARVPAYLSFPDLGGAHPLVLLLHAGASSKDSWWQADGYERAASLTRKLLEAGFAVFAMDARNHGERSNGVDYVPIPSLYFNNKWWATVRAMVVETSADHLRALQYLSSRTEVNLRRIGTVGQSMGGFTAFYLAALDPRIAVIVAGAPALGEPWLYPLTAMNFSTAIKGRPVLVLAGDKDQLIPKTTTDLLMSQLGSGAQLHMFSSDHRLPAAYTDVAFNWLQTRLRR